MSTKKCRLCKEWKSVKEFIDDPFNRDGLQSHCSRCGLTHMLVNHPDLLKLYKLQTANMNKDD